MRRALAILAVLAVGCTPKVPPQPPQPPPLTCPAGQHVEAGVCVPDVPPPQAEEGRPIAPVYLDLLMRGDAGRWNRGGTPHDLVGAIPCWPTDGTGDRLIVDGRLIPYWWPLTSPEWIDHVKTKGANAVHVRPGPVAPEDACCGMKEIGGGPILADGSYNAKWWARFHSVLRHAGAQGFTVEVDVLDTWIIKHAVYGDVHSPFPAEDVHSAMSLPLNTSVRKWVAKIVSETDGYGHVIYQIGTESELAVGWSKEWERAMHALIRAEEKLVVHMIGSNTRDFDGPYDYFISHSADSLTGPINGRPVEVNEQNPSLPPGQFKTLHCTARKAGQAYWYWRSDGSDARQDESLNLLAAGCDAAALCPTPQPPREKLAFTINCVREICDVTPIVTKALDYCQSIGMGEMGGQPRAACPMRNECGAIPENFDCANRLPCEQYAMSVPGVCNATAPLFKSDGVVEAMDQFGFRVRVNGSWIEACACDGSHCTRLEFEQ